MRRPSIRWRDRRTTVGAVALACLSGGAVLLASGEDTPRAPEVASAAVRPAHADQLATEDSALEAGVVAATLMARLFPLDRGAALEVVSNVASDSYRPALASAIDNELGPLQRQVAGLAGRPVYRQSVLAARLVSFAPPRAQVGAWVMVVAGQAEVESNVVATFATVTVDLVFENGRWRLNGTTETRGPSPQVNDVPSTADALEVRLDGYADWRPGR